MRQSVLLVILSLQAFHYMSFAILVFFMLEIFFKIFVFHLEFFHHKFEILDAIVVVVSFVLDLVLLFKKHQFEALGLLILLRLWRVARIINGVSPVLLDCMGVGVWALWLLPRWQYSHQMPAVCITVAPFGIWRKVDGNIWRELQSMIAPKLSHTLVMFSWLPEGSHGRMGPLPRAAQEGILQKGGRWMNSAPCWLPNPRVPSWSSPSP